MISFDQAFEMVLQHTQDWGTESLALLESTGRVLAEDVYADRDFPPFDRSTRDGIALKFSALEKEIPSFQIEGVQAAGTERMTLGSPSGCFEIMTGAVLPEGTDTVVMYEGISVQNGLVQIHEVPKKGQNIHVKGSDIPMGGLVLEKGCPITGAEIGILATVGKAKVVVKKLPKICVISTGNELVEVSQSPKPHQIRKSNSLSLYAALSEQHIQPQLLHLKDDKKTIREHLSQVLERNDVVLLSGGVSKGKFDFIPEVLDSLGVQKIFHRVAQRPGKPFWFGVQPEQQVAVFSFPGNPVSTYANYHIYFLPWLYKSMSLPDPQRQVMLEVSIKNELPLTHFVQVKTSWKNGVIYARPIKDGGSGDLASLSKSDGFICLRPRGDRYEKGEVVPMYLT